MDNIADTSAPTCSLSANASTISTSASDNVGIAYQGWSSSYSGDNSTSKSIASGTHTYYVKDTVGNTNTCSISIKTTTNSISSTAASSTMTGACYCCKGQGGTTVGSYVSCNSNDGCSCPSGTSQCNATCTRKYSCNGVWTLSGTTCYKTYTVCESGYTRIDTSNYCYK